MLAMLFASSLIDIVSAQALPAANPAAPPLSQTETQPISPSIPPTPKPQPERVDKVRRIAPAQAGVALPMDTITVTLPIEKADLIDPKAKSGRLILFFRAVGSRTEGEPLDGPFFEDPQPIGSVEVDSIKPGIPITLAESSVWFPGGSELFEDAYEVQAVLDVNNDERGHLAPGNLVSKVTTVNLTRDVAEVIALELTDKIPASVLPELKNVEWVDLPSPILSKFAGRVVTHRAGVIFPAEYHNLKAKRRIWPTIYVIPGFGGRWTDAADLARKINLAGVSQLWPQAVYVILDPESPLGHHGFVNSALNGPRGFALVSELIPYLQERFRLIRDPSARVLTGHSSGAWTSVWLALNHPETFGAAFASSPDPLDFHAFQMNDLYRDENLFIAEDGIERPSFREPIGPGHEFVPMLVREEVQMERAISPNGTSGEQWDSWAAMFSPAAELERKPRRLCNPMTGVIDPVTVEAWSRFDIARRISKDWDGWGKLFIERVRVIVGERDSFYLERAAIRLRDAIAAHAREQIAAGKEFPTGPGYIEIVPGATHDSVFPIAQFKFSGEIREYLRGAGHHE